MASLACSTQRRNVSSSTICGTPRSLQRRDSQADLPGKPASCPLPLLIYEYEAMHTNRRTANTGSFIQPASGNLHLAEGVRP